MKNEFVSYEAAMRLKKLGFDEPCFGKYDGKGKNIGKIWYEMPNQGQETIPVGDVLAPTFSQAFGWLRENHRMFHEVFIDTEPSLDAPTKLEFAYLILHMIRHESMYTDRVKRKRFDTYEDAQSACLDRILEVLEGNS